MNKFRIFTNLLNRSSGVANTNPVNRVGVTGISASNQPMKTTHIPMDSKNYQNRDQANPSAPSLSDLSNMPSTSTGTSDTMQRVNKWIGDYTSTLEASENQSSQLREGVQVDLVGLAKNFTTIDPQHQNVTDNLAKLGSQAKFRLSDLHLGTETDVDTLETKNLSPDPRTISLTPSFAALEESSSTDTSEDAGSDNPSAINQASVQQAETAAVTRREQLFQNSPEYYKSVVIQAVEDIFHHHHRNDPYILKKLESTPHNQIRVKALKYLEETISGINAQAELSTAVNHVLARQDWSEIESKVVVSGKIKRVYSNRVKPVKDAMGAAYSPLIQYEKGVNGISSRANLLQAKHAANIWMTSLTTPDHQELFKGIRHGVLTMRSDHEEERETAAKAKAMELIKAAVMMKHQTEIENILDGSVQQEGPLKVKMTSTSLMTMYDLEIKILNVNEPERTLNQSQIQGLKMAAQELKQIEIDGKKIEIDVEVCSFCASMNDLAMHSVLKSTITNEAWPVADALNHQSLLTLLGSIEKEAEISGWVGEYLQNHPNIRPEKEKLIRQLVDEIRDIFTHKKHHSSAKDICKLSKRILLLTYEIDAVAAYNCKSGKDRTSVLDSEVKALAAKVHSQMRDLDKSPLEQSQAFDLNTSSEDLTPFYLDPVNMEIQQLNTGLIGNKCMDARNNYYKKKLGEANVKIVSGYCRDT